MCLEKLTKNACSSSWVKTEKMAKVIIMMVTRHEYIVGIDYRSITLHVEPKRIEK